MKASWATGKALAYTSREGTGSDSGVHRAPLAANRQTVEGGGGGGLGWLLSEVKRLLQSQDCGGQDQGGGRGGDER